MSESEFESNLFEARQATLNKIEALGQAKYPNQFLFTDTIPQVRAKWDEVSAEVLNGTPEAPAAHENVTVAGRIMAIRAQGKAGFASLQQGGQRLQIYVRLDAVGEQAFALYKLLDMGDHIGASGYLFRTRTGELTIHVETLTFLAKAMLALPEKFHGLSDVELRYRQRYVDLFTNLDAREVFVKRAKILKAVRKFFDDRDYLEVETPMMQQIAGGAAARPFKTHHNALEMELFLRIAPELYLKRLVVGGLDRVYEINRNFRNEGVSTQHNPEFTMLEFYQAYANFEDMMTLTIKLIEFVSREVTKTKQLPNGTTILPSGDTDQDGNSMPRVDPSGQVIDLAGPNWRRLTMTQAIVQFWLVECGDKPNELELAHGSLLWDRVVASSIVLDENIERMELELGRIAKKIQEKNAQMTVDTALNDETDAAFAIAARVDGLLKPILKGFQKVTYANAKERSLGKMIYGIFETVAEPQLFQPTIIYDYPTEVSPLSKAKPDDPAHVERFEFFIGGFEVGNAFSELNDPVEQQKRFEDQLVQRAGGDDEAHQMDEDYVRALAYGLPPTAGEGIGIDRLTMLLTGSKSIRDVILFPLMREQQGTGVRDRGLETQDPQ